MFLNVCERYIYIYTERERDAYERIYINVSRKSMKQNIHVRIWTPNSFIHMHMHLSQAHNEMNKYLKLTTIQIYIHWRLQSKCFKHKQHSCNTYSQIVTFSQCVPLQLRLVRDPCHSTRCGKRLQFRQGQVHQMGNLQMCAVENMWCLQIQCMQKWKPVTCSVTKAILNIFNLIKTIMLTELSNVHAAC